MCSIMCFPGRERRGVHSRRRVAVSEPGSSEAAPGPAGAAEEGRRASPTRRAVSTLSKARPHHHLALRDAPPRHCARCAFLCATLL